MIEKMMNRLGYIDIEQHNTLARGYAWALFDVREFYDFVDSLLDEELSPEVIVKINSFLGEREWVRDITVKVIKEDDEEV